MWSNGKSIWPCASRRATRGWQGEMVGWKDDWTEGWHEAQQTRRLFKKLKRLSPEEHHQTRFLTEQNNSWRSLKRSYMPVYSWCSVEFPYHSESLFALLIITIPIQSLGFASTIALHISSFGTGVCTSTHIRFACKHRACDCEGNEYRRGPKTS